MTACQTVAGDTKKDPDSFFISTVAVFVKLVWKQISFFRLLLPFPDHLPHMIQKTIHEIVMIYQLSFFIFWYSHSILCPAHIYQKLQNLIKCGILGPTISYNGPQKRPLSTKKLTTFPQNEMSSHFVVKMLRVTFTRFCRQIHQVCQDWGRIVV